MRRATVDLPQPDSPTSPKVSPFETSKLTRSTARRMRRGSRSITRFSHGRETSKSRLTDSRLSRCMQPAGGAAYAGIQQIGALHEAAREASRAAWVEGTARWDGVEARHCAFDLNKTIRLRANFGNGSHEAHGIGMARRVDHVAHWPDLDVAPGVHDGDALRGLGDDAHVVRDEHHRG